VVLALSVRRVLRVHQQQARELGEGGTQ
jgi:hypothetical protein